MTRTKTCSTCGTTFEATRAANGKWPATCSPPCRLAALDRLIESLLRNRRALSAQIHGVTP